MYYDKTGKRINLEEYAELFEKPDYKFIAKDENEELIVSTIWLGLDHGYGQSLKIFETMVFTKKDGVNTFNEIDFDRYSAEREAIEGHKKLTEKFLKARK